MKFIKKTNWKSYLSRPFTLCLILFAHKSLAAPFGVFDARTMAMGGVGVATGSQYAAFNNPALLSTADEIHEWFMLVPTVSEQFSDPNDVEDSLSSFQQAADALDLAPNATNRTAVQQQLDALDGNQYSTSTNKAIVLAIPSRILSGAAFFNVYEASTAKPVIGGDDLTIPSYASTLAQRGLRVVENGVAASKVIDAERGWMVNMAIGFSVKFLLVEGYGYSEPLRTADVEIERTGNNSGSQFAIDLGMHKELGVWNLGLVAKNIVPGNYKYGPSGDEFKIEPQLRAGLAYKSRYSVLELDIDLLENDPVGFDQASQIGALGWEWQVWEWLALRAGYNQNLTGNEAAYGSGGIGLNISGLQIDVAGFSGDEGEGVSAQIGLQF
jgi:hypothetical protein